MSGYFQQVESDQRALARKRKEEWQKSPMCTVWVFLGMVPFAAMLFAVSVVWLVVWVITYTTTGGDYLPKDAKWWADVAWWLTGIWVLAMVPFGILLHVRSKRLGPPW